MRIDFSKSVLKPTLRETFITRIRVLRRLMGLSVTGASAKMKMSRNTLYALEENRSTPNLRHIQMFMDGYDVPAHVLFGEDEVWQAFLVERERLRRAAGKPVSI